MWTHPEAHPGEYLRIRFLEPLHLTASDLAAGCRMPRSRVSDLLLGKRAITPDTAMRLGRFFRMEPEQWLALQAAWDLATIEDDEAIEPLDPPGFLLGPLGATEIPPRRASRPTVIPPPAPVAGEGVPLAADQPVRGHHEEIRYPDGTRALVWTDR